MQCLSFIRNYCQNQKEDGFTLHGDEFAQKIFPAWVFNHLEVLSAEEKSVAFDALNILREWKISSDLLTLPKHPPSWDMVFAESGDRQIQYIDHAFLAIKQSMEEDRLIAYAKSLQIDQGKLEKSNHTSIKRKH